MGERIYLHETVNIIGAGRAAYFDHMIDGYADWACKRGMRLFGIWGTLGSTGHWPEVINLWDYGDWANVASIFAHEARGRKSMQDPELADWWKIAQQHRSGGFDRLVQATDTSPNVDELERLGIAGSEVFRHDIVKLAPGTSLDFLILHELDRQPYLESLGLTLAGAFRTLMHGDDEAIMIWACRTWEEWAEAERTMDCSRESRQWQESTRQMVRATTTELMVSAARSPTQTGQQPL